MKEGSEQTDNSFPAVPCYEWGGEVLFDVHDSQKKDVLSPYNADKKLCGKQEICDKKNAN